MSKMETRMPQPFVFGSHYSTTIQALFTEIKEASATGEETLWGFRLPDFQRPPVWTVDQNIRFVESIWMNMPIGSYMINRCDWGDQMDNLLLDGQQRLRAIWDYANDGFEINGLLFSELNEVETRIFRSRIFPRYETKYKDETMLREVYNRLNFGGTPHTQDQMA